MRKQLTARQKEAMDNLAKENNKLRWLCVVQPFKCKLLIKRKLLTLGRGWYELTSSGNINGNWMHKVKKRDSKEYYTVSDKDYMKIINTFKKENNHLL